MSKQLLVGLTGPACCGKDSVASCLVRFGSFRRYALADPIKFGIEAMFDLHPSIWEDRVAKEKKVDWLGRSPRYLAQTLGTEWGRTLVHPDVWLLLMQRKWEAIRNSHSPRMVVPDVRFDNEAAAIIAAGGTVWKVVREVNPVEDHVSERGLDPALITGRIMNNGPLDELAPRIVRWLPFLLERYGR